MIEDEPVTARLANTTIVGGEHGVLQILGTAVAVNTLVSGSTVSCFEGEFSPASRNNAATDDTAPGAGSIQTDSQWLVGPFGGSDTDAHLGCDPLANATITHSAFDLGNVENVFNDNLRIGARTPQTDSAFVQIELDRPLRLTGSRVGVGYSQESQWWLEVADSVADLETQGESYRLLVKEEPINAFGLPNPGYAWDEASFAVPETATIVRLRVDRSDLVDHIYLGGWVLEWADSPCNAGVDLPSDPAAGFSDDVDGDLRATPWDIGYDEASYVEPFLLTSDQEVWERELVGTFEVALDRPYPVPISVSYRTYELSATEGEDYSDTTGQLTIPTGEVGATISVPVNYDGIADDGETFNVELLHPSNPDVITDSTFVILRDGKTPPEISVALEETAASESAGGASLDGCLGGTEADPIT